MSLIIKFYVNHIATADECLSHQLSRDVSGCDGSACRSSEKHSSLRCSRPLNAQCIGYIKGGRLQQSRVSLFVYVRQENDSESCSCENKYCVICACKINL